jgi:RND family efflux transporter MFP subunit
MASEPPLIEPPAGGIPPSKGRRFFGFLFQSFTSVKTRLLPKGAQSALETTVRKAEPAWKAMESKLPPTVRPFVEKNRRIIVTGLALLLMLLLLRQCVGGGIRFFRGGLEEEMERQEVSARADIVPVKVFKIGRFNYEDTLNALGTIKGAVEFKLSFEIPGVISSINYREGERYEEGALLMSLRQDDILLRLKRAQAEMNKAEADVGIAERKYEDQKKLFEIGAIPDSTLSNSKLEFDKAYYALEGARLEVKANEVMLEKSNLYAPSKGMIGELNVEEGEAISPNTLLGSHIVTEHVFSEFGVVERDVNKIQLGQKARVFVDAYPDKTFEGIVENIAPMVAGKSRTASVRVRLENPEDLLLPGMFTRVRILLYSKKNTIAVPTDSVQGEPGQQFVYVANPKENLAEKRAITVGYTRPDYTQIDSGLSEGELVITSGLEQLEDKKKVKIIETQEAEL